VVEIVAAQPCNGNKNFVPKIVADGHPYGVILPEKLHPDTAVAVPADA
jgi:hypothetical protein